MVDCTCVSTMSREEALRRLAACPALPRGRRLPFPLRRARDERKALRAALREVLDWPAMRDVEKCCAECAARLQEIRKLAGVPHA